jgi:hypothetical protein
VTSAQLLSMAEEIKRIESSVSVVTRVTGFFTFTNTVWFFAIVGIAVSIGPALYHILKPLRDLLKRIITWVFDNIVTPVSQQVIRMIHCT